MSGGGDPPVSTTQFRSAARPEASQQVHRSFGKVIEQHIGLVLAGVALLTVVLKLRGVAHGDPTTIGAIVREQGYSGIVVASVLSGTAAMGYGAIYFAVTQLGQAFTERDPIALPLIWFGCTVLVLGAIAPWRQLLVLVGGAVIWLVIAGPTRWWDNRRGRPVRAGGFGPPSRAGFAALAAGLGLFVWGAVAFSDRMWLPAEVVTVHDGSRIVGYVLADGDALVVLVHASRSVERLEPSQVADRQLCSVDRSDQRSVLNLLQEHARVQYPACPE